MPETVFDFFDRWCAITRGPLCHTLIGATVFVNKKPGVFEPKIVKTIIVNDDYSVAVEFEDGDTSYSGCIYSKPKAYEL